MFRFIIITFSFLLRDGVSALNFDQRQTGDLNVQVDLKNFKIFALTKGKEEYVDYDYAYDYSEMTIKPQNGTTSTTTKPLNITDTVLLINKENVTVTNTEIELTTKKIKENNISVTTEVSVATTGSLIATNDSNSTAEIATTVRHELPPIAAIGLSVNNNTTLSDCKKGFFRNSHGNCELKLQNPSNMLLKMLQQKSKPSGGNGPRKL